MRNPNELSVIRLRQISAAKTLVAEANKRLQMFPPPNDSEIKGIMQQMGDAYYRLGLATGVYQLDSDSPDTSFIRPDPVLNGRKVVTLDSYTEPVSDDTIQWKEPVRVPGAPDSPTPLPTRPTVVTDRLPQTSKRPHLSPGKDFRSAASDPSTGRAVFDAIERADELQPFTPISKPSLYRLTLLIQNIDPELLKRMQLELTPERVAQFEAIRKVIKRQDPEVEMKLKKSTADVLRRIKEFLKNPDEYLQRCPDIKEAELLRLISCLSTKPVSRSQFLEHATRFE